MSHSIQPIPLVTAYFGADAPTPIITQEFQPAKGWHRTNYNKRVSRAWVRKLQHEGVTQVTLSTPDSRYLGGLRSADFRVDELLKIDRRPLFSGNVI